MKKNSFPMTRAGIDECIAYKDYKGLVMDFIKEYPEVFPVILGIVLVGVTSLISPAASVVAYKSSEYEVAKIAFKCMNGGF